AELVCQRTQTVQRVRMGGSSEQQSPVHLFCPPQQATAVQRDRERLRLRKAQGLPGREPTCRFLLVSHSPAHAQVNDDCGRSVMAFVRSFLALKPSIF